MRSSPRRRGAAQTVAEECERLFCGTLRAVFLGEGNLAVQDPLALGALEEAGQRQRRGGGRGGCKDEGCSEGADGGVLARQWIEMFDYAGGARFRGFVAGGGVEKRALFVFFDEGVSGSDLKPGLMALLELCELPDFECSRLVACLDRQAEQEELATLTRDLGWVGFEPYTLADWTVGDDIISNSWVFLSMGV